MVIWGDMRNRHVVDFPFSPSDELQEGPFVHDLYTKFVRLFKLASRAGPRDPSTVAGKPAPDNVSAGRGLADEANQRRSRADALRLPG